MLRFKEKCDHLMESNKKLNERADSLEKLLNEEDKLLREKESQLLEMDRMAGMSSVSESISMEMGIPLNLVESSISYIQKCSNKLIGAIKHVDRNPVPEPLLKGYKDYLCQLNFAYMVNALTEKFDEAKRGMEKIRKVVKNLESFSDTKKEFRMVDINHSLEEAIKFLRAEEFENVEIVMEFQPLPELKYSATALNQCLYFILENALYALENNGIIRVSTTYRKEEREIIVRIVDNGKGMSPEVLSKAFKPFFSTKPAGQGSGLGLSIIERIIKNHNGRFFLSSKEHFGTTATIILPVSTGVMAKKCTVVESL
jgi:signal transduction histidine kinase